MRTKLLVASIGTAICLVATADASGQNDTWASIGPDKGFVLSVATSPLDPQLALAGTMKGLYRSADGGETWSLVPEPKELVSVYVTGVAFDPQTPGTAYALTNLPGGGAGPLWKSTDAGVTWTKCDNGGVANLFLVFDPRNSDTFYFGDYKTTDAGSTAKPLNSGGGAGLVIDPTSPDTLYVAGAAGIRKSVDGGGSWQSISTIGLPESRDFRCLALDPSVPTTLYTAVEFQGVYRSDDGGVSWSRLQNIPVSRLLTCVVDPQDTNQVYATDYNSVWKSTDRGASWGRIETGLPTNPSVTAKNSLALSSTDTAILFLGASGSLYRSSDGGASWSERVLGIRNLRIWDVGVNPGNSDHLFALTDFWGVNRSTDRGRTWSSVLPTIEGNPFRKLAFDARTPATVYAFRPYYENQKAPLLATSSDWGATWALIRSPQLPDHVFELAVDPQDSSTLYMAGLSGFYRSTNRGVDWGWVSHIPAVWYVYSIAVDPHHSNVVYAATDTGLSKTADGGQTWSQVLPYPYLPRITESGKILIADTVPSTLYYMSDSGMARSTDGGVQWEGLPVPQIPPHRITDFVVDPQHPHVLYAALPDLAGGVVKSIDGGSSWFWVNEGLSGGLRKDAHLLAIDARDPGRVYVNSQYAGLFARDFLSISGGVTAVNGSPLAGVTIGGLPGDPVTDTDGYYYAEVPSDWSGSAVPMLSGYRFVPAETAYTQVVTSQIANYTASPSNQSPVANAGPDQSLSCGVPSMAVTLNGSGSSDPDGDPLTYTWREGQDIIAGPIAEPSVLVALGCGVHDITLIVSDGVLDSAPDETVVNLVLDTSASAVVVSSGSPSNHGETVTFTATVTGSAAAGVPTGTVTFKDGEQSISSPIALDAVGAARFSVNSLSVGVHSITASYSGDANHVSTSPPAIAQIVNKGVSIVSVTASPNPSIYGSSVTLRADVTSLLAPPTGTITFSGLTSSLPIVGGSVAFTLGPAALSVGTHTVTALYSGDANLKSGSGSVTQTVDPPPSPSFSQIFQSPPGACICTPVVMNTDVNGAEEWFVKADDSGHLDITAIAYAANTTDPETVNAKVFDSFGNQLLDLTASYGPNPVQGFEASAAGTIDTLAHPSANGVYRVEVMTPSPTPAFQTYYRLKFTNAIEAATPSPSFASLTPGRSQWLFNVSAPERLNVRIFSNRVPSPPPGTSTETIRYQWVPPGGEPLPLQTIFLASVSPLIDQTITPVPDGSATPGIWTLVLDVDQHYRLQKTSGADRGIYLNYVTSGRGTVHVAILDGHGSPFAGPVLFTGTYMGTESFSFTASGSFDDDAPTGTYHVQVVPPPGLTGTPEDLDFTVLCDQQTDLTFVIADLTPPNLTLPLNVTAEATGPLGALVTFTATASDFIDGSVPVTCSPASGSTFPLGTTEVGCSAADNSDNTATGSFGVTVVDTTPPVLTLPANITAEATSAAGAVVTFTATALDLVDGVRPVTCAPASRSTFAIQTTTAQCSSTDAHGNTATSSFTVSVRDTTPPVVSTSGNVTVNATSPAGAVVTFAASATDIVDGSLTPTCTPASGAMFAIGTTTVMCAATDQHQNTGSAMFTIGVLSPEAITNNLVSEVSTFNFQQASGLLQNVLRSLSNGNTGAACNQLGAFINQVQAQAGKQLTTAEASALVNSATDARGALGCK